MRLYRIETEKKIITGAVSGIGKEIVKQCLSEGASVIACDINKHFLSDLKFYPKKRQWCILPMKSPKLATALLHACSEFNGLNPVNYELLEKIIEFNIKDKAKNSNFWRQ